MKNNNIIMFGPPNAGKSTLIGYLYVKLTPDYDFAADVDNWSNEAWYNDSQKYAYITDRTVKERLGEPEGTELGRATSRSFEIVNIKVKNHEYNFIDTPGHPALFKGEAARPLYGADIGVFVISTQILKSIESSSDALINVLCRILLPLKLWINLDKGRDNIIIAISKMDLDNFSQEAYNKNLKTLREYCDKIGVQIGGITTIPISIDVKNELGYSVLEKHEELEWDEDENDTFFNIIKEKITKVNEPTVDIQSPDSLFLSILKHRIGKAGHPNILVGKLLRGRIKNNDIIKICPIEASGKIDTISGTIRNIQKYDKDITEAEQGDFIGLSIGNAKTADTNRRCDNFDILSSTIITRLEQQLGYGNVLKLKVEEGERFNIFQNIQIYWFGRFLQGRILSVQEKVLIIQLLYDMICIPVDNKKDYLYSRLITLESIGGKLVPAEIIELGFPQKISMYVDANAVEREKLRQKAKKIMSSQFDIQQQNGTYEVLFDMDKESLKYLSRFFNELNQLRRWLDNIGFDLGRNFQFEISIDSKYAVNFNN